MQAFPDAARALRDVGFMGPGCCTLSYESALLRKSFPRPGPKSVGPAMNCAGVEVAVWWKFSFALK
jgi:hypothetical protein